MGLPVEPAPSSGLPSGRLVGLDVARCLALVGMVSVHMNPDRGAEGSLTVVHAVLAGRSAALFAVLAGVGLALVTGRQEPVRGWERAARSVGVAVRALMIAAIGLALGGLESGLAVILTHYGVLFLLGLPFLGLRARALLVLAGVWTVAAPVVSHLLRPHLPRFGYGSPDVPALADPAQLLSELLFTGYYPVVPWLAYLLAGMGVGRLALTLRPAQLRIAASGAALAMGSWALSRLLTSRDWVMAAMLRDGTTSAGTGPELRDGISGGLSGTTPSGGSWLWLVVVAPHSSTPFDVAHTIGTSLLVLGTCLLLVGALDARWTRRAAVAFGAGTMTLSLYTLHVVMRSPAVPPDNSPSSYPWHIVVLMGIGALFARAGRRGPLEWLVGWCSGHAAALVRRVAR